MKNKLYSFMKKHCIGMIGVIFLLLIVVIPILINLAFKKNWGIWWLQAEWDAGAALSFYGTVIASVGAIIGVYFSIQFAQKNYRQDELNKIKPYMALTHYRAKSKVNLFSPDGHGGKPNQEKTAEFYKEYRLEKIYIIIGENEISFMTDLKESQKEVLRQGGLVWNNDAIDQYSLRREQIVSMPFVLENVGNGAALNVIVSFYKEAEERKGVSFYTIKCDQYAYIHIFSNVQGVSIYGNYILEITYRDIMGNDYSQKYPVTIERDKKTGGASVQIYLAGKQELVRD